MNAQIFRTLMEFNLTWLIPFPNFTAQNFKENPSESNNELEVSIDQFEQIVEEKEVKAEKDFEHYKQEAEDIWERSED